MSGSALGLTEELRAEQDFVDRAYQRLDELRTGSSERAGNVLELGEGGTFADRVDRDVKLASGLARRAALSIGDLSLCFGRIDRGDGERFHVGRIGVSDVHGDPLVVDWRAPAAEVFYRATSHDPMGVWRRRYLRMLARRVVGIEDELLDEVATDDADELVGGAALLAALARARTGRMGDIVATIQGAQDEAIRAPLPGMIVVQGGPGTGKTAVALHRAAYLLYEYRFPLASQGVLVIGPNAVFLRYVEDVLPGLGETGVRLATPAELVTGVRVTVDDAPEVAAVKADVAMVDALRRAIEGHQCPLAADVVVPFGAHRLALSADDSALLVHETSAEGLSHHAGRLAMERRLLRALWSRLLASLRRAVRSGMLGPEAARPDATTTLRALRETPAFTEVLDRLWPALTPTQVLDETLTALRLPVDPKRRSEHDAALIDEAAVLLGPVDSRPVARRKKSARRLDDALDRTLADMGLVPSCPSCGSELTYVGGDWECERVGCGRRWKAQQVMPEATRAWIESLIAEAGADFAADEATSTRVSTFGHVVVDEAQDLTPMQWRVIHRRCPSRSMTVVGDLGQAKHPWSPQSWEALGADHVVELTVNYRTPEEVMAFATPVLAAVHPDLTPPRSVRQSGEEPVVIKVPGGADAVLARAREMAVAEANVVAPGRVAVLLAASSVNRLRPDALEHSIVEIGVEDAKGLEFDAVVVVEPARFTPAQLYVALTRTTRRLVLVHAEPLPETLSR